MIGMQPLRRRQTARVADCQNEGSALDALHNRPRRNRKPPEDADMLKRLNSPTLLACLAAALFSGSGAAPTAEAGDWWKRFKHENHVVYQRNNVWPQPFSEMAAAQTRSPFEVMKHKGWMLNNTIGHELFRDGDGALTAAGRGRVHWIATQAPVSRRVVNVLRGSSEAETEARVDAVRSALDHMYLTGPTPPVYITEVNPATSPGIMASQISRQRLELMTPPTLPEASGGAGGAQ